MFRMSEESTHPYQHKEDKPKPTYKPSSVRSPACSYINGHFTHLQVIP